MDAADRRRGVEEALYIDNHVHSICTLYFIKSHLQYVDTTLIATPISVQRAIDSKSIGISEPYVLSHAFLPIRYRATALGWHKIQVALAAFAFVSSVGPKPVFRMSLRIGALQLMALNSSCLP